MSGISQLAASADQDLAHWIRLDQVRGVGPDTAQKLLLHFGLPANIFSASFAALTEVVSARIAQALLAPLNEASTALIEKSLQWVTQRGNRILTLADADYPAALLQTPAPPLLLYVKGRSELLARPALAIVGSRNATVQGTVNAKQFSEALSQQGITIVSGLALGIDTAAHQGALHSAENQQAGSTVAVIGTGIDIVYPARNRALAHQIAEFGCLVSEYPLGMPAIAVNFPRRNRIISGLSQGVLVVEAALQSGSLITARMAADQGRDVFAIPGSIHSPLAKGCHQLIKQGAKLVESAQDILDEYNGMSNQQQNPPTVTGDGTVGLFSHDSLSNPLLDCMGFDPVDLETLVQRTGIGVASLHAQLFTLELQGLLEKLPGEIYRRIQ